LKNLIDPENRPDTSTLLSCSDGKEAAKFSASFFAFKVDDKRFQKYVLPKKDYDSPMKPLVWTTHPDARTYFQCAREAMKKSM